MKIVDAVLATLLMDRPVDSCLDIGCGQGEVLSRIADGYGDFDRFPNRSSSFFGIDLSGTAIRQADESRPDLMWIQDSIQNVIEDPSRLRKGPDFRFRLIVDKGGFLSVGGESDLRLGMQGLSQMLNSDGVFLLIRNRNFYLNWLAAHANGWDYDPIELASQAFGPP